MKTGRKNVRELDGLGRKMPVTFWCFTLVSITLIGIPPTSAFVSKWYLGVGALESGIPVIRWLGVAVLLVSALLTAGYLLTISLHVFFSDEYKMPEKSRVNSDAAQDEKHGSNERQVASDVKGYGEAHEHGEIADPGPGMLIPLVILTAAAVILGILPGGLIGFVENISSAVF